VLAERGATDTRALVAIREQTERGGTAVFIYAPHAPHNFALFTAVLDELGLSILDAHHRRRERLQPRYPRRAGSERRAHREPPAWRRSRAACRALLEERSARHAARAAPGAMFPTLTRIDFSADPSMSARSWSLDR
jgi:UTP:GlnB (protein PII) uridylyltransferase